MDLGINFGQEEAKAAPSFLPAGNFPCISRDVKWGRSAAKGTPYMEIEWECVKGEHKGGKTRERKYITPGTAPYFKGWSENTMNVAVDSTVINEKVYSNRVADVQVKKTGTGEYDTEGTEKMKTEVDSFKNAEYFDKKNTPISASHGAQKGSIQSVVQDTYGSNGGGSQAGVGNNAIDNSDDDIPF